MINTKEIKKLMIDAEMNIGDLARELGITRGYTSDVIHGRRPLTLAVANKMQDALGISNADFGFYFLDGGE